MKVLIACEYSGIVRDAFSRLGHDAISCDLLPSDTPGHHYQGDVLDIINNGFDLIVAHPPCTYLCNSGVSWLGKIPGRKQQMEEGANFFKQLLNANIPKVCIENPIMHRYAKEIIGVNQSQVVQPYMFGHMEQKATCLWLKGLPILKETNNVKEQMMKLPKNKRQRLHYLPPSKERWKLRSTTYQGMASAMANQWSQYKR